MPFQLIGTGKVRGAGNTTFVCGRCRTVLIENAYHGQFRNIVIQCPKCDSYNDIP